MPGASPTTPALGSDALPPLPAGWSVDAQRTLALGDDERLPLPHPDAHFDLVHAGTEFTRLTDGWADWLLELHRVTAPDGVLVAALLGGRLSERLLGEAWEEDRVGMNVLRRWDPKRPGAPFAVHSQWWVRAHWGRAFEVVELAEGPELGGEGAADPALTGHIWVLLRKRDVELTSEELERPEPGEPREVLALRHNVSQLDRQLEAFGSRMEVAMRAELNEVRESFRAELERKSVRVAEAERAAQQATQNFKSTLSWRVTKPLRVLRQASRSARRG